ncbi:MAG: 23S rRNA (adenine(2503)-C(2))-methyltransferase RlmN [Planctomycetes bacterium]|nr:23S rRNA (adenine(2503)-C(2))-methyltransferase RlmN [Planctomycetota bacterium]
MSLVPATLQPLFAATLAEFGAAVAAHGGKSAHARELRRGVLRHGPRPFADVELRRVVPPTGLRERLAATWRAASSTVAHAAPAGDGSTKLVVALADGRSVESVVMPAEKGHFAVCISSQVGCPVGCPFCASGLGGLVRHLAAHEIVEQVAHARAVADVRRIVVMGIGEPLLNFDALLPALDVLVAEGSFAEPRIVVSSVGFPERVRRLAASGRRFGLAISLHSIDDAQRDALVPAMKGVAVREVIAAAAAWAHATGGRVQFEYVVLRGVNDDLAACDELARQLKGLSAYVNFIAWNDVPGLPFARPDDERVAAMVRRCRDLGLLATRRRTLGGEATAACGQLRRSLGGR